MNILPINLDDLIQVHRVESVRLEFKKTWSDPALEQIIRTVCAFANDFFNLNGGYIVLGVEERDGLPVLPPSGLDGESLDKIQIAIRGRCERIDPGYQPVLSPEVYQGKQILVIWVPAGDARPYRAPESNQRGSNLVYYVRQGSQTTQARDEILSQLMQLTARTPFDDRRNNIASVDEISPALVRNYLANIKSDLVAFGVKIADAELYRYLKIVTPVNSHEAPRNVALLFFINDPEQYFRGARIEVVQFGDDAGGDLIEEKVFRGPLNLQVNQALDYLNSLSTTMLRKLPNQAEVARSVAFPYEAMEEALVNAVYHRSYENVPEPVKVYLYPDRMEIISYPGPVPGIEMRHLQKGASVPPVPNRNRRIGEFLKDLRLAEARGTGIPKIRRKMNENGSPEPVFEFDEQSRSYFRVILPAHPQFVVLQSLRESAQLWATGERERALQNLDEAHRRAPHSGALVAQMIDYMAALGDVDHAESLLNDAESGIGLTERFLPYLALARALLDRNDVSKSDTRIAAQILQRMPPPSQADDIVELALLNKRSNRLQEAHQLFASNYDLLKDNAKAVHEFAQTKIKIASDMRDGRQRDVRRKLNREAAELLHRAIQLSDDSTRTAWCWYDLARVLAWLKEPESEILSAYSKAVELLPQETRFKEWHQTWKKQAQ
jgi:ATP-dependent DNA helicase RecG